MVLRPALNSVCTAALLALLVVPAAGGLAQGGSYTINGSSVAPEMGALLQYYGYEPGAYFIDPNGNYGRSGGTAMGNINGGPMRGWDGVEPTTIDGNPYAQAFVNGVAGIRVYYAYSPSIGSDIRGGASGYYHICPDNVFHRSHEGSVSMGGGANKDIRSQEETGFDLGSRMAESGRWSIDQGPQGPILALYGNQGNSQQVPLTTIMQGKWKYNQTTYVVETGKASC